MLYSIITLGKQYRTKKDRWKQYRTQKQAKKVVESSTTKKQKKDKAQGKIIETKKKPKAFMKLIEKEVNAFRKNLIKHQYLINLNTYRSLESDDYDEETGLICVPPRLLTHDASGTPYKLSNKFFMTAAIDFDISNYRIGNHYYSVTHENQKFRKFKVKFLNALSKLNYSKEEGIDNLGSYFDCFNIVSFSDNDVFKKKYEKPVILNIKFQTDDFHKDGIPCTITQALPFFEKFKLGLFVYDQYQKLLYKYEPELINKKHYSTLRVIAKDNHYLYEINDNVKSLQQTTVERDEEEIDNLYVNDKFYINHDEQKENVNDRLHMIKTDINEITNYVKQYATDDKKKKENITLRLILKSNDDLSTLLIDIYKN
eukprot:gene16015-21738_t